MKSGAATRYPSRPGGLRLAAVVLAIVLAATACTPRQQVGPASITLEPATLSLAPGDTAGLIATVRSQGGVVLDVPVSWSSSDEDVATVSAGGVVAAQTAGTATITASAAADITATAGVTVTEEPEEPEEPDDPVVNLVLSPASAELILGGGSASSVTLTATYVHESGAGSTPASVIWTSTNETIATVENGIVTAQRVGTATIRAFAGGGLFVAEAGITVNNSVVAIATGYAHSLALLADGTLRAWGHNDRGQLGNGESGENVRSETPVPVHMTPFGDRTITAIAAGGATSYALLADGTVYAWGSGFFGQLGNGVNGGETHSSTPIPVDMSGIAPRKVVAIAPGDVHVLALLDDGAVYAWGENSAGQLGIGVSGTAGLRSTPVPVILIAIEPREVVAIAAGSYQSFAILDDGAIYAWGSNYLGELGDGSGAHQTTPVPVNATLFGTRRAVSLDGAVIGFHNLAALEDGTVYAWGNNSYGQLGNGESGPGTQSGVPVAVDMTSFGERGAVALAAGFAFSLALLEDGSLHSWGEGDYGQLGNGESGSTARSSTPVPVDTTLIGERAAVAITSGALFSLALLEDGTVVGWGDNGWGQLGIGEITSFHDVPVRALLP